MSIFWQALIKKMKSTGLEPIACVPPGDMESEKKLLEAGARLVNYNLDRKGLNPLLDLATFASLKKIIAKEKPDLVFASTIKPVIYASLAAKINKTPGIFATITGLGYVFERDKPHKKLISWIGTKLYRLALKDISGVYFQNRDDSELFKNERIVSPSQRLLFAPGAGVNTGYFTPAPFPEKGPVFLLSGRLLEAKGIMEFAQAAAILKSRWPDARFQLLGIPEQGPGSLPLERVRTWEKEGVIEYLGQTRDVRSYLRNSHIAVLPSWREGTPTSLLEAMATGRPCVATDVPGCREVVKDGVNGWLCEVRNPESLARSMEKFLLDPQSIPHMGTRSRQMAVDNFDAETIAANILNEMIHIIKNQHALENR